MESCIPANQFFHHRQRLTYICKFYEYVLKEGWVKRLPFANEERTDGGGLMGKR
ncbi:hypothetical protein [Pseudomonas grandcourensis]|uniref:hypothetical protein n=1 Tax=Pseudomonas grandcourensis TaxID=3136736 RepID=UPI0032634EE5